MAWVVQMISPVLRCHHRSGSSKRDRTVSTASTTRTLASITGNEKILRRIRMGTEWPCSRHPEMMYSGSYRLPEILLDEKRVRFGKPDQAMQIGPGDT